MDYYFRKAELVDKAPVWEILKTSHKAKKKDGSNQWQDGYQTCKL
jgi:hypothetical protein